MISDEGTAKHRGARTPAPPAEAKDLIDRAFSEPLDLDALAKTAGYSRFHFARSFKDAYGRTPRAYLSWRRVERARDLLRSANLTVTEVCFVVGFSSLGTFSARFKELVGVSPSEYREREIAHSGPPPIPGCFVLMWSQQQGPQSGRSGRKSYVGMVDAHRTGGER